MKKILQMDSFEVEMPRKILIGDPFYLEEMSQTSDKEQLKRFEDLIYNRGFRGKGTWKGSVQITKQIENLLDKDNKVPLSQLREEDIFQSNTLKIAYAEDLDYARLLVEGSYYSKDKVALVKHLGVDTAEYLIQFNNTYKQEEVIRLGCDGYIGEVFEFKNKTNGKLSGILIELDLRNGFSENVEMVKRLCNVS